MVWTCNVWWRVGDGVRVCLSSEGIELSSVFGDLVIEVDDVVTFLDLCRELRKVRPIVGKLVNVYVEYDLPQWVSTHSAMARRVARLKKLLRILDEMYLKISVGNRGLLVSVGNLLQPVTARLREIVEVLEFFRDEVHRVRDRVHTFVYPALLSLFDVLRRPWRVVMTIEFERAYLVAEVYTDLRTEKVSIDLEIDTPKIMLSKRIDEKVLKYVVEKGATQLERLEILREMVRKIIARRARKRLEPIEEVPSTLWAR